MKWVVVFAVLFSQIPLLCAQHIRSPYEGTMAAGLFCDDLNAVPILYDVDYSMHVQPIFNFYGCADCHNGSDGGLNLSTNSGPPILNLLGYQSNVNNRQLIEPFEPSLSYLLEKVNCDSPQDGNRMPFGGSSLTTADQAIIFDWIYQGALGEFPPGLWYREIIHRDNFDASRVID